MDTKQRTEHKTNQSKGRSRKLGDNNPSPESPQSRGHDLGGYRDRSNEGKAREESSPGESGCANITTNGKDADVNTRNTYSTSKETQNLWQKVWQSYIPQPKD